MKNKIISLGVLLICTFGFSQVGINTENPQGIFNIDGAKDNPSTGAPATEQQLNDFVVTTDGNVGIGTTTPSQKLEINTGGVPGTPQTGFKLTDGNQTAGYVLTSDAAGVGTWENIRVPLYTISLPGNYTLPANTGVSKYTGVSISLPPGKWMINFTIGLTLDPNPAYSTGSNFVRFRLQDDTVDHGVLGNDVSADVIVPRFASSGFSLSMTFGTLNGSIAVNNTSPATKTYYLFIDNALGTRRQVTLNFNWTETYIVYYQML